MDPGSHAWPGGPGAPKPQQPPREPASIRFGIDQILGGCGGSETDALQRRRGSRPASDPGLLDLGLGPGGGSLHPAGPPAAAGARAAPCATALSSGAFRGMPLPYEEPHQYRLHLTPTPGEVIRIPAHRPMVPAPGPGPVPGAAARFGFIPWMSSSPQFAKDRFAATLASFSVVRRVGHPYQNRAPPRRKKPRTSFSRPQVSELEKRFHRQKYLASAERSGLAKTLQMTDAQVKTWFQNRRTKWRRQSAEEREAERQQANRLMVQLQHDAFQKKLHLDPLPGGHSASLFPGQKLHSWALEADDPLPSG